MWGQSWLRGIKCDCKSTGCGFDPHSRRWNIYLNLYFHFFALVSRLSAALSSAPQHAMPPEFGRKWGTECLNTRFPLPILLSAGYSVKLKKKRKSKNQKLHWKYIVINVFLWISFIFVLWKHSLVLYKDKIFKYINTIWVYIKVINVLNELT